MRKIKEFVITSFFGGFFVLLPLLLLWKLFAWLFRITSHTVSAPAHFIIALTGMWEVAATGLSLIILAAVCFLVGVFAKSRFGESFQENPLVRYRQRGTLVPSRHSCEKGRKTEDIHRPRPLPSFRRKRCNKSWRSDFIPDEGLLRLRSDFKYLSAAMGFLYRVVRPRVSALRV